MIIMSGRLTMLRETLAGHDLTGRSLISFYVDKTQNIGAVGPTGIGDDPGIFYFVPLLVRTLGLGVLTAVDAFYYTLFALATVSALVAFFLTFRRWQSRLLVVTGLASLLAFLIGQHKDVYLVAPALVIGLAPWGLWFFSSTSVRLSYLVFAVIAGALCGYGNLIRGHAGTGTLLFLGLLAIGSAQHSRRLRAAFLATLVLAALAPYLHFHVLLERRDRYLEQVDAKELSAPKLRYVNVMRDASERQHPLWHSVYIGFGYLSNDHGIRYSDTCAWEKARQIDPSVGYMSHEYEQVLKHEVGRIWENDRPFAYRTIAAKVGVLLFYFVWFANIGLPAAFMLREPRALHCAFLASALFYALPGVLVIPRESYVLGFMAVSATFGIVMAGKYVERVSESSLSLSTAVLYATASALIFYQVYEDVTLFDFKQLCLFVLFCVMTPIVLFQLHVGAWAGRPAPRLVAVASHVLLAVALTSFVFVARGHVRQGVKTARMASRRMERQWDLQRHVADYPPRTEKELSAELWEKREATAIASLDQGCFSVRTSESPSGHQMRSAFTPKTGDVVRLQFEIEVVEGGATLAILDDKGHWLDHWSTTGTGTFQGSVLADVSACPEIHLVFMNNCPGGGGSGWIVRKATLQIYDGTVVASR